MLTLGADEVRHALDWPSTIAALEEMFRAGCEMPVRHHHTVQVPGAADATLLLMPAWSVGAHLGVKVVNVFPGNSKLGLPAVMGLYLLFSATTGALLATMDGSELTARRTAAASALAARYLARKEASRLVVVGAGRMAENCARPFRIARDRKRRHLGPRCKKGGRAGCDAVGGGSRSLGQRRSRRRDPYGRHCELRDHKQ